MKLKPTTIYVIRHGETLWNVKKLLQGHADSALTPKGEEQAHSLKKMLAGIRFAAIFSSDLERSKRTAEIISLEKKLAVQTTKLLRERSFGRYEGKPYTIFATELKALLKKYEKLSAQGKFSFKYIKEMDSDEEIVGRFITFVREIAVAYTGKNILVVTHGGMMRALLIHFGYGTYKELAPGAVKNTSFFTLETDGIEFNITKAVGIVKQS